MIWNGEKVLEISGMSVKDINRISKGLDSYKTHGPDEILKLCK